MPLLFSYGTLQHEDVQLSTFGRRLTGRADSLVGFEAALVPIEDPANAAAAAGRTHHANAAFTGNRDDRVSGTVFEVTDAELEAADEYERPAAYIRIETTLASGARSWVYVHAPSAPRRE
jgi:gamma-glutamylcyclotransferase (GGCT)/AIG2-like uncharacterized protein YtfP